MKKIITIFAAISMLAVSCQREDIIINKDTGITTGKLTARFAGTTKVSYTYMDYDDDWNWNYDWDEDEYWMGLLPAWEIGDKIIGFTNAGTTFTLTVESVAEDGVATLSGTGPTNGEVHLIYKYGAQTSDIINKTLAVDYSGQAGDKTMPAVMLANGTIVEGSGEFTFTNAGAVIDVWFMGDLLLDTKVKKVTLSGENLSGATIALDGSNELALTATEIADDAITVDGLDLTVVDDDNWGTVLSSKVWVAVPDGAVITKISVEAQVPDDSAPSLDPVTGSDDYVTIAGKKWAKRNIGATNEKDYGRYFYWGSTERYYLYEDNSTNPHTSTWHKIPPVGFSDDYDYTWDTEYTPIAGTHCLCDPSFEIPFLKDEGYSFNWQSEPYNNGEPNSNVEYFNTEWRDIVCPGDVLAPAYDAAHVYWGGTWRMPTKEEFLAMKAATYWAWDADDKGYYVYTPDPATDAGKINASGTGTYNKSDALLFFPAAGKGTQSFLKDAGSIGVYWSSTLYSSGAGNAESLQFNDSEAKDLVLLTSQRFPYPPRLGLTIFHKQRAI